MGISFQDSHPQDTCAFCRPHNIIQDFTGQAQKTMVAVAMMLFGATAKRL